MATSTATIDELDLLDWKRAVFALYAGVRATDDPREGWDLWQRTRDRLFAEHPQSPLPRDGRATFAGLDLYPYDPAVRVLASVESTEGRTLDVATSTGPPLRFRRFAVARFALRGAELALPLYWLEGYGGGVFLPFADATTGRTTFGAGRYLIDTVKGADLGGGDGRLVLDFNFAYNPSCAYDPGWACPLAPPESRLAVPVAAGERTFAG